MNKKKQLIFIVVSVCLFFGFACYRCKQTDSSLLEYFASMYTPSKASTPHTNNISTKRMMTFGEADIYIQK